MSSMSIPTLARWQLRRTRFLLLFIALGMIAAVVIACAIPLFSDVMATAGLRATLRATPDSADIQLTTGTAGLSSAIVSNVRGQFDPLLRHSLGSVLKPDLFAALSDDFSLYPTQTNTVVSIFGASMQQVAPHLALDQGRLARVTGSPSSALEVMMTPDTARFMGVKVGSTFKLAFKYIVFPNSGPLQLTTLLTARVAGLFHIPPALAGYWHGEGFTTVKLAVKNTKLLLKYSFLIPANALLALADRLSAANHVDSVQTLSAEGFTLLWHYHLDASQVSINDLDPLINHLTGVLDTINSQYGYLESTGPGNGPPPFPYLVSVQFTGQVIGYNGNASNLEEYRSRIDVARIPTGLFTILILSLLLFFVSLLTALLVDRQQEAIALLRSRGASRWQVFGALFSQSIALALVALLIGLPLATLTVALLARRALPGAEQDALTIITRQPWQAMLGTIWYALAVVGVALLATGLALLFAARMDMLSLRRETARSGRRPLWQRFNLDVLAGVVALIGYVFSLYLTSISNVLSGDAQTLIASPLSIIAPLFLIIGFLFLFLRLFPLLLKLGARLAARGRGAVSLLAFAQVARSPRQSLRVTMLLALATAFSLFTLVFLATQQQHIQDIVTYQTGADFSAELLAAGSSPAPLISQYKAIPGVLSASVGFDGQGFGGTADLPMDLRAVDTGTFGQTVIWPSLQDQQAARPLLAQLIALRRSSTASDIVPAIIDQTVANAMPLHAGSVFTITLNNTDPSTMRYLVIGVVNHIPTINTLLATEGGKAPVTTGGVLVDYQTYLNAFHIDAKDVTDLYQLQAPEINQIWLRSGNDAASLASVRSALDDPNYRFTNLADRRLLLATLQSDPLYLILNAVLILGTITAFLVALVGDVLVSWLSARTRQVSFVTLRALGSTTGQVARVLTWEQTIVYVTGLLLGCCFGALLIYSVIPALTLTDLNSNLSNAQLFALQSALSTQITLPPSLPLVLVALAAIYLIALLVMVRIVAQPTIGQKLRLDEA